MIVRETTDSISKTTNSRDVAGAKAVSEMFENVGANITLKPNTKVNDSGTLKNLSTYINGLAETIIDDTLDVEDISSHFTTDSDAIFEISAYKSGNVIQLTFVCRPYNVLTASAWNDNLITTSDYLPKVGTPFKISQGNTGNVGQNVSAIIKGDGTVSINIGAGTYAEGNYMVCSTTYITD